MKIKTIQTNIKGRKYALDLAPVTLLFGPSFSGKTAVLDAIRLGLLGYHPKLGKRATDTMLLASGDALEVVIGFDNGVKTHNIRRAWGSMKGSEAAPIVPPALLDCREFFSLTGAQRINYLFEQVKIAPITEESLRAACLAIDHGLPNEYAHPALQEAAELIAGLVKSQGEEGATAQELVVGILDAFAERKKEADAQAKQFVGLAKGSTRLKEAMPPDVSEAMVAARKELEGLHGKAGEIKAKVEAQQQRASKIQGLEKALKNLPDRTEVIATLRGEIEKLTKELLVRPPDQEKIQARLRKAQTGEVNAAQEVDLIAQSIVGIEEQIRNIKKLKICKACTKKLSTDLDDKLKNLKSALDKSNRRSAESDRELKEADSAWKSLNVLLGVRDRKATALAQNQSELEGLLSEAASAAHMRGELEALDPYETPDPYGDDVPILAQIEAKEKELAGLEEQHRQFIAAKAADAQVLRANQRHAEQSARSIVFKLATQALQGIQQGMIDAAVGSLLAIANKFTAGILRAPLAYRGGEIGYVLSSGAGALGLPHKGWVSHETFSGTETALAYAGLSVALAQQSPFKIVLIDELGIADSETKVKIVERMVALEQAGIIDQFIGCDVTPFQVAGAHSIHMA